jgi:2-oxo-4-hydroxy-4-carboxy-5-ureidoimidazoline decarboxylase
MIADHADRYDPRMDVGLERLNRMPAAQANGELRACCAAASWVAAVVAARPYPDRASLQRESTAALRALDWAGVREAIDVHPRIGERVAAASTEASWSAAEQSGMNGASAATRAALVEANRAYEERFGHVFLIFATGRTDEQMLAAARERVHHDDAVERETVRAELAKIVALRLTKLLDLP